MDSVQNHVTQEVIALLVRIWVFIGICLLLLGGMIAAADEAPPPANPADFHAQELARLRAGMESEAQRPTARSTQADYDALFYQLTLDFRAYSTRTITGATRILVRSLAPDLNELVLDLCDTLTIDSIRSAGGASLSYTRQNHVLTVALGQVYGVDDTLSIRVHYHGTPCQSSYFQSFMYYNRPVSTYTVPTMATLSEPYGARDWWPSKNDPSDKADSARISIIVADTLTATSNGLLEAITPLAPSSRMFTWFERYPISTYLICASATNFAHYTNWYVSQSGDSVPIEHYPYAERLSQALISWSTLPAMMSYCASVFGEYPFLEEKYGHTMFSFGGAMEHQCNTSYGRNITTSSHTYDYIVQHELAHQWYGDEVTLASWANVWLNEGFASYAEALWFEHLNGFAAYRSYMTTTYDLGVTDPSGPVYNPTDLFNANTVYNKGAWIVHMLRGLLDNDSLFFAALREYRVRHSYGNAITAQFFSDIADITGLDAWPYLGPYLYGLNRPHYTASIGSARLDGHWQSVVRIRQTQIPPDTLFAARLDLRLGSGGSDTLRVRVENAARDERYYFTPNFAATTISVDPDDWVLKAAATETLPLTVLNPSVAGGLVNTPYLDTLVAVGAQGATNWILASGALPPGITLSPEGILSGWPTTRGHYNFRARVTDALNNVDSMALAMEISIPLAAPFPVTIYQIDGSQVELRWPAVADADSYRVYRSNSYYAPGELRLTTADTVVRDSVQQVISDSTFSRIYTVTAVAGE